jgi:uncharacterized membrane protein
MNQKDKYKNALEVESQEDGMNTLIGYLLFVGVALSAVLIAAGFAWHWARTGQFNVEYTISKMNLFEFTMANIRRAVDAEFRPRLLISLGIAALLLTPYLRVLVSLLFFAFVKHNWKYSFFTGFVLIVLTYTLFLH